MGLAERFKGKLENKNIFKNEQNNFISSPINNVQNIEDQNPNKFENLETEIISKIRKTPYWEEYSKKAQTNMIGSYFDKKITKKDIQYSTQEKEEFIKNILILSNNK